MHPAPSLDNTPEHDVSVNGIASNLVRCSSLKMSCHSKALLATIIACSALTSNAANAQSIRGTLVDSATGAPLTTFAAVLLDARGVQAASAWSRDDGRFVLQAPREGDYTVRVQRLGYRKRIMPVSLRGSQLLDVRIAMSRIPISLTSVRVVSNARCEQLVDEGSGEVSTVWEAARSAFELVALSATRRDLVVKVLDETMDSTRSRAGANEPTNIEREGRSVDPYPSRSPDSISRFGYVQASGGEAHYYAPGPGILMSDEFLRDHCFRLEGSSPGTDRLGIAFEPTSDRRVTEVAGIVWMVRSTSEPISVDYHYTRLPAARAHGTFGGHAEFVSLPDGGWLLREWTVRAPIMEIAQRTRYSSGGGISIGAGAPVMRFADSVVVGSHVERGRILLIRSAEGRLLWADSLGAIVGRVMDSTTREPLRDVSIKLRGSPRTAHTDATGRFLVDSIVPGHYPVVAELRRFGLAPLAASTSVTVARAPAELTMVLPLTRATVGAFDGQRDAVARSCSALQARREREIDAEFRIAPNEWVPGAVDSAAVAIAMRRSLVVLEAIVDTTGRADPNSIRILRNGPTMVLREAIDALHALQSTVEQPQPGCKVRHLLVLPYVVRGDQH